MKNQTQTQTQVVNANLNVCAGCKQTGTGGAKWLLIVEGQREQKLVHKPCREKLVQSAPPGVAAKVVPSRELRAEWQEKRQNQQAKSFWDNAFSNAKPLKVAPTLAPSPAPTETAKAA